MNRRSFLKSSSLAGAGLALTPRLGASAPQTSSLNLKTKHLIWIINGNGCRKKEYLEDLEVAPHFNAMAKEGYVFNEDHNDQASSHGTSYTELLTGNVSPQLLRQTYRFSQGASKIRHVDAIREALGEPEKGGKTV